MLSTNSKRRNSGAENAGNRQSSPSVLAGRFGLAEEDERDHREDKALIGMVRRDAAPP